MSAEDDAQTASAESEDAALELFELDSQLHQLVVSSTKTQQTGARAPAVITVITRAEMRDRGYRTLAEVLRSVPGFYDVYDLVHHNVGVRGINGGARASGSVLKLMIDGHAVDYRPTTGNFFGEELIPLEAIERVEVIRGPASALYGANAFLGVVNVITRGGAEVNGVHALADVGLVRTLPGGGGGVLMGAKEGRLEVLLAARIRMVDRSGLRIAESSPILDNPRASLDPEQESRFDRSRPRSLFARVGLDELAGGRLSLMGTVQNLDARGAFLDFAPLSDSTRIASLNQNYRAEWRRAFSDAVSLQLATHAFSAGPTEAERIDSGRPDELFLRHVGAQGFGVSAESRVVPPLQGTPLTLILGADFVQEDHLLQTYDARSLEDLRAPDGTIIRAAGTITPGEQHGASSIFRNVGVFAQGSYAFGESWSVTGGARADLHNIYGLNPSGRLGVVFAPPDGNTTLKLLYGSSFKAPSAEQLYTQPLRARDIQGNPELKAQTAHTVELAAGRALGTRAELSANVFVTDVVGRVEYVQRGLFLQARNLVDEWVAGGELDVRLHPLDRLDLRLSAGVARTVAQLQSEGVTGLPEVKNPLFPPWQLHLVADYGLPLEGAKVGAELSLIGPRVTSQSNALQAGDPYELPPYLYNALFASVVGRPFGERETRVTLRFVNLANQSWPEPGFGGVDVPAVGLSGNLSLEQEL